MRLSSENGVLTVAAETYTLIFPTDRPFVVLDGPGGQRYAELFTLSSIHPLNGRDDTAQVAAWIASVSPTEIVLTAEALSSAWERKTYHFRCQPDRFFYEVEVEGSGQLAEANLFGGYSSANPRWGSGFFYSGQTFERWFNPEPNTQEAIYGSPENSTQVDLTGVPLPGRASWFFTPPPFFLAFERGGGWLGVGICPRPGEYRFTEYAYHGRSEAFHLSLAYDGHTSVDGRYALPAVEFRFGDDPYDLLGCHTGTLVEYGASPQAAWQKPGWWYEPIFCGWGSQCYSASSGVGAARDYARQETYRDYLGSLEQGGVQPGTVVIDDKWQTTYGENRVDPAKWPDLRGFIREQHGCGRHVLLWLKAWDPEGLPVEECITNAAGLPVAADPTSPAYERRLRQMVRTLFSPEGYGADGFKIDFTARIPSGPGLRLCGDLWGLELMRRYLEILHGEAKQVKPDAMIMTHTPHPYLADLVDVIRLNDINTDHDVNRAMTHRARVARLACPEAVIDTDNWPLPDRDAWREYLPLQAVLGVPSLYYAAHIDSTHEPLESEDYRLIRETWQQHRERHAGQHTAGRQSGWETGRFTGRQAGRQAGQEKGHALP